MLPHRHAEHSVRGLSLLYFLDDVGIGLLDKDADARERLAAPVSELLGRRIDQTGRRVSAFCSLGCAVRFRGWLLHPNSPRLDHLPAVPGRIAETRVPSAVTLHRLLRKLHATGAHAIVGGATVV